MIHILVITVCIVCMYICASPVTKRCAIVDLKADKLEVSIRKIRYSGNICVSRNKLKYTKVATGHVGQSLR